MAETRMLDRGELDATTHPDLKPPSFSSVEEERAHRKARLAGACRIFARQGYDHWVAGHLTVRDPEHGDRFWVNPLGVMPGGSVAEGLVVREAAEHYVAIARELLAVYRSLGYEPQDFFAPYSRFRELLREGFEEAVEATRAQGRRMLDAGVIGRPSLHVDLMRGRPTEVEYCLGPFLAQAERAGIEVPTVRAGYRIIRTLEQMLA